MVSKKSLLFFGFCIALSGRFIECMEIFQFIEKGQHAYISRMIDNKNFDPNIKDSQGQPLIFVLVEKQYFSAAEKIVAKDSFNPHIPNKQGQVLLSLLSDKGYTVLMNSVMAHKNFNLQSSSGMLQYDCGPLCKQAEQKGYEEGYNAGYNSAHNEWLIMMKKIVQQRETEGKNNGIKKYN